jgi:hypothetical protein
MVGHTKPLCPRADKALINRLKRPRTVPPRNGAVAAAAADADPDYFDSDMDEEIHVEPTCNGPDDEQEMDQGRAAASVGEDEDETEERDGDAVAEIAAPEVVDLLFCIPCGVRLHRSGEAIDLSSEDLPANEFKPKYRNRDRVFEGLKDVPADVKTEGDFLNLFWTDEIWENLVKNTNSYAEHHRDKNLGAPAWKPVSVSEMKRFFGMNAFFGFVKVPERRDLWNQNSKLYKSFLSNCMTRHRFEEILQFLHWEDTSQFTPAEITAKNKANPFWRVATLEELLCQSFQKYYICGRDIDVDEAGIPTRCRHHAVQYNGDKPWKWFFKLLCLNDANTGYLSNFYLFRGKDSDRPADVSASAYPVVKLTEPQQYHHRNHICYIDNYFNGVKLLATLISRGIHGAGTVRSNRVKSSAREISLFWSNSSKKGVRGKKGDRKQHKLGDNLYVTSWYDKKAVNMLHTYPSKMYTTKRNISDPKTRAHTVVDIEKPTIIADYNWGMGGTDLFDQFVSYYRAGVKTKKWPHCVLFHFFSTCIVNSWILYKIRHKITDKHTHGGNLYSFQDAIISFLCPVADVTPGSANESAESKPAARRTVATSAPVVINPPVFNGHFVTHIRSNNKGPRNTVRKTCKLEGCGRLVGTFCRACKVALCIGNDVSGTSCFEKYHALGRRI